MVVALKPLHEKSIINRVVVSTYQAVSGAGKTGMDELFNQTQNVYANQELKKEKFTKQIAFNAIPHIGAFLENGNTEEEPVGGYPLTSVVAIYSPKLIIEHTTTRCLSYYVVDLCAQEKGAAAILKFSPWCVGVVVGGAALL